MSNVKVWAHRGASGWDVQYAPENTLPAFEKAVAMGADGIELDVQMTKDKELVICHDEYIDRTSDGHGLLQDYTLKELKKFNFNGTHREYSFTEIPTLGDFFQFMRSNDLQINIELKNSMIFYDELEEKVLALAAQYSMEKRIIYSSFNHYSMQKIKKINPQAKVGLLIVEEVVNFPKYAKDLGADAVHPAWYILYHEKFIEECKKNSLKINTWVVDNKKKLAEIAKMGIDVVITNCPDNARAVIDGMKE